MTKNTVVGGYGNIKPKDGKQFSSTYQPDKEVWDEATALKFCNDLKSWLLENDENLFVNDFIFLKAKPEDYHPKAKIYPDLTAYLSKKFTSCFDLLELAKKIQETKLVKMGIFDKLNATILKFVLINLHDWKDKVNQDHTSTDGSMSPKAPVSLDDWYNPKRGE